MFLYSTKRSIKKAELYNQIIWGTNADIITVTN